MIAVGQPLQMQEMPVPVIGEKDILVRVRAAGICHSDVHYRAGVSPVRPLPMTLGHEVAGVVEQAGAQATNVKAGEQGGSALYITCGECSYCTTGNEQFCSKVKMLGHYTDGGYAEYIAVPARNAVLLPDEIPFEQGATLMCASATAFPYIAQSRLKAGETAAVFGVGDWAYRPYSLQRLSARWTSMPLTSNENKLKLAAQLWRHPCECETKATRVTRSGVSLEARAADVTLELIGLPQTMRQAVQCLDVMGRVRHCRYRRQAAGDRYVSRAVWERGRIIGSNDHLYSELPMVVELARRKVLDTSRVVTRTISLDAGAINRALE